MQTSFSIAQLADPDIREMEANLRKCVHCGFCLPACPTYSLLGDERDSPRGRIYLVKGMIEAGAAPTPAVVNHIDQCLSCLACMSACPSGVDYQHYIDHARHRIERDYNRPLGERLLRRLIMSVLPHPGRFRAILALLPLARPIAGLAGRRVAAMARLAPRSLAKSDLPKGLKMFGAAGKAKARVLLSAGCAQQVLRPAINDATVRLLTRAGADVEIAPDAGCCGALVHHLGETGEARQFANRNIAAWRGIGGAESIDAIIANASGCGTHLKDYTALFGEADARRDGAAWVAEKTRDVAEFLQAFGLPAGARDDLPKVVYHDACSLMHGQGIVEAPRRLLRQAGFELVEAKGTHYCCGSAGSYNLLQPDLAAALNRKRAGALAATGAAVIATGNIGCLEQLAQQSHLPVVHTVELLDWATGGPKPPGC